MAQQYIKVTPKGDTRSHVVLAHLRDFYTAQGAKIEQPTEEEIREAFPFESGVKTPKVSEEVKAEMEDLRKENDKLTKANNKLNEKIKSQTETINSLNERLAVLTQERDESEQLVQTLRKELAQLTETKKD